MAVSLRSPCINLESIDAAGRLIISPFYGHTAQMATTSGSSNSHRVSKRLRPHLPLIMCGECKQKIVMEFRVRKEGPNKGRIFYKYPDRNCDGTGCKGWYWKEEYVQHVQNQTGEAVSQQEQTDEGEHANDLSILVGIGHQILMLLKYILVLVCLMLVGIVYIIVRLPQK